jgi:hypothetical protein
MSKVKEGERLKTDLLTGLADLIFRSGIDFAILEVI